MQRTVYSTKFTYAVNEIDENGNLTAKLDTITIHESDVKTAYKKACKKVGNFVPLKTEKVGALYVLDDEIFFKYAKVADNAEVKAADNAEVKVADNAEVKGE